MVKGKLVKSQHSTIIAGHINQATRQTTLEFEPNVNSERANAFFLSYRNVFGKPRHMCECVSARGVHTFKTIQYRSHMARPTRATIDDDDDVWWITHSNLKCKEENRNV